LQGHSSGEIAAAYCAGHISFEVAITVAWIRGQVSGTVARNSAKGGMMAISLDGGAMLERLALLKSGKAIVACWNSPKACTISGDSAAIDELHQKLKEEQIPCTRLPVDCAYHSHHMDVVRGAYEKALAGLPTVTSGGFIPMFSSTTGSLVRPDKINASYWVSNLVSPVNFVAAVKALLYHTTGEKAAHGRTAFASVFLEVGPHSALRSYLLDIFRGETKLQDLTYSTLLRKKFDAAQTALQAIGELWTRGCDVNVNKVNELPADAKPLVDLPPYAWNHTLSFWGESYLSRDYRLRSQPRKDLIGYLIPSCVEPTWRNFLRCNENPWIREHKVQGNILYPGAGMVIMAIEGARQLADPHEEILGYELRDVSIVTALRVPDTAKGVEVMVQFHHRRTGTKAAPSATQYEFTVSSWSEDAKEWTCHARGLVSVTYKSSLSPAMQTETELENSRYKQSFLDARQRCQKPARNFLYDTVETIGMEYG
jgi:acyl transferase domain-containing protein